MRYPALFALAWVAADCAAAWSWVAVSGGADAQRAWHALVMAGLVLACWPLAWWWTRQSAGKVFYCVFGFFLSVPIAIASASAVDFHAFALVSQDRPTQAWNLSGVAIGLSFALAATVRRGRMPAAALVVLSWGAVYSFLLPVEEWICGPQATGLACGGLLGGSVNIALTAAACATLAVFAVEVLDRVRAEKGG